MTTLTTWEILGVLLESGWQMAWKASPDFSGRPVWHPHVTKVADGQHMEMGWMTVSAPGEPVAVQAYFKKPGFETARVERGTAQQCLKALEADVARVPQAQPAQ